MVFSLWKPTLTPRALPRGPLNLSGLAAVGDEGETRAVGAHMALARRLDEGVELALVGDPAEA